MVWLLPRRGLAATAAAILLLLLGLAGSAHGQTNTTVNRGPFAARLAGTNDDAARAVATDASGNTYLAGSYLSATLQVGAQALRNAGEGDVYVAKFTPAGQVAWAVTIGGRYNEILGDIAVNSAGTTVHVFGSFRSLRLAYTTLPSGKRGNMTKDSIWDEEEIDMLSYNAFLLDLDGQTGEVVRALQFGEGDGDVAAVALALDEDRGNLVFAANFNGTMMMVNDGRYAFVNGGMDVGVEVTDDDSSFVSTMDAFIGSLPAGGSVVEDAMVLTGDGNDYVTDLALDPATGDVFVSGSFASNDFQFSDAYGSPKLSGTRGVPAGFLAHLSSTFTEVSFTKAMGKGSEVARLAVEPTANGACNLYALGIFTSSQIVGLTGTGGGTPTVVRLASGSGIPVWARALPAPADLVADPAGGRVLVMGQFVGAPKLADGVSLMTSSVAGDLYIAQLDIVSGAVWAAQSLKGGNREALYTPGGLAYDKDAALLVVSGGYAATTLAVGDQTLAAPAGVGADAFVAKVAPAARPEGATASGPATLPPFDVSTLLPYALRANGADSNDVVRAVAVDGRGLTYVAGNFRSGFLTLGDVKLTNARPATATTKSADVFLAKLGPDGRVLWATSWGGNEDDLVAQSILDAKNDALYVLGSYKSQVFSVSEDMAIRRGSFWDLNDDSYGDDDDDLGSMMTGMDDDLFGTAKEDNNYNIFVAKVDTRTGAVSWVKGWGDGGDDRGVGLALTNDAVLLTASFSSAFILFDSDDYFLLNTSEDWDATTPDILVARIDPDTGDPLAVVSFAGLDEDLPTDLVADAFNGSTILVSGTFTSGTLGIVGTGDIESGVELRQDTAGTVSAFLTRMDTSLATVHWARSFNPGSTIAEIAVDPSNGNLYVAGLFPGVGTAAGGSTFLRLNPTNGQILWARAFPQAAEAAIDFMGFLYVAGVFSNTVTLSPTVSLTAISRQGGDLYVAKVRPENGGVIAANSYGGSNAGKYNPTDLAVDTYGAITIAGSYENGFLQIAGQTLQSPGQGGGMDGFASRAWIQPGYTRRPTFAPTISRLTGAPSRAPTVPTPAVPTPAVVTTAAAATNPTTMPATGTSTTTTAAAAATTTTTTTTTTLAPTKAAVASSASPSQAPTQQVVTQAPSQAPTTRPPSQAPTPAPSLAPSVGPSHAPSAAPTPGPTLAPTEQTTSPTPAPTKLAMQVTVSYAGDAAKVPDLEKSLAYIIKPYVTAVELLPAPASNFSLMSADQPVRLLEATAAGSKCADESVEKLDLPFAIQTSNVNAAAKVLDIFRRLLQGDLLIASGADFFDSSVLCGMSFTTNNDKLRASEASKAAAATTGTGAAATTAAAGSAAGAGAGSTAAAGAAAAAASSATPTAAPSAAATSGSKTGAGADDAATVVAPPDGSKAAEPDATQTAGGSTGGSKKSGGAGAGAGVGIVLGLVLCAGAFLYARRRRRDQVAAMTHAADHAAAAAATAAECEVQQHAKTREVETHHQHQLDEPGMEAEAEEEAVIQAPAPAPEQASRVPPPMAIHANATAGAAAGAGATVQLAPAPHAPAGPVGIHTQLMAGTAAVPVPPMTPSPVRTMARPFLDTTRSMFETAKSVLFSTARAPPDPSQTFMATAAAPAAEPVRRSPVNANAPSAVKPSSASSSRSPQASSPPQQQHQQQQLRPPHPMSLPPQPLRPAQQPLRPPQELVRPGHHQQPQQQASPPLRPPKPADALRPAKPAPPANRGASPSSSPVAPQPQPQQTRTATGHHGSPATAAAAVPHQTRGATSASPQPHQTRGGPGATSASVSTRTGTSPGSTQAATNRSPTSGSSGERKDVTRKVIHLPEKK